MSINVNQEDKAINNWNKLSIPGSGDCISASKNFQKNGLLTPEVTRVTTT